MKNLIILISFLLLATAAKAQKIYFTDTTNVWYYISEAYWKNTVHEYSYHGDTVANSYTYFKLGSPLWVREDTAAGIVYYSNDLNSTDNILYNYNLQLGDTFTTDGHTMFSQSAGDTFILTAIDTINIAGYTHKLQRFDYLLPAGGAYVLVIEGLGSWEAGFILNPPHPDDYGLLSCFENNKRNVTIRPAIGFFDNIHSCELLSVNELTKDVVQIVPNPANSNSILWLSQTLQHGKLLITNAMGQKIAAINIKEQSSIALGAYISTPGVYIYQLSDLQTGAVQSGRFVFE